MNVTAVAVNESKNKRDNITHLSNRDAIYGTS